MTNNFQLTEATVFPDLNAKEQQPADYSRMTLSLNTLRYKHFRGVLQYPEQDQMHHLMLVVTGLSESDLGELTPDDSAEVSNIVFNAMKKYIQLGKTIVKSLNE